MLHRLLLPCRCYTDHFLVAQYEDRYTDYFCLVDVIQTIALLPSTRIATQTVLLGVAQTVALLLDTQTGYLLHRLLLSTAMVHWMCCSRRWTSCSPLTTGATSQYWTLAPALDSLASVYVTIHHLTITCPLTAWVVEAPQMTSQPFPYIFLCFPLPSGTWRTPSLSIP